MKKKIKTNIHFVYNLYTTQKGVAIKKIFELRAENRTECSLGW